MSEQEKSEVPREEKGQQPPAFLIDGMLGTLATKLRILGFDTVFDSRSDDSGLLRVAKESQRVLVTSDSKLFLNASKHRIKTIFVREKTDKEALEIVLSKAGIDSIDGTRMSRCSICNGNLLESEKDHLGRITYVCSSCGKVYWKGSHWRKLDPFFAEINRSLSGKDS